MSLVVVPAALMLKVEKSVILMRFTYTLLLCLLATCSFAQDRADDTPMAAQSIEQLQQQSEKILRDSHAPGMSVATVHREHSDWLQALVKPTLSQIGQLVRRRCSASVRPPKRLPRCPFSNW